MIVNLAPDKQLLYNRLNASSIDIGFSRYCAGMIQKKKWHLPPWTRRRTQYPQQIGVHARIGSILFSSIYANTWLAGPARRPSFHPSY